MRPLTLVIVLALTICSFIHAGDSVADKQLLLRAQESSRAFALLAKKIRPAVVNIKVQRTTSQSVNYNDPSELFNELLRRRFPGRFPPAPQQKNTQIGQGSGVIVSEQGYILTNNHVVGKASAIEVKLHDGRTLPAELIGTDPDSDVAVIRIKALNLVACPMSDSDTCQVGEWVLAVGNPFGLDSTVTSGIISAKGRSNVGIVEIEDFIQTDAAINPGNSGGPLINLNGEVIGINTAIFSKSGGYQGIGFSIPINIARNVMNGLIANRKVTTSYLGVTLHPLTAELARGFGLSTPQGALVSAVLKDTPAATAGVLRGDVILKYGKRVIKDDSQLRNLVATTAAGELVEVLLFRAGRSLTVRVKLEAVPEQVTIARKAGKVLEQLGVEVTELTRELRAKLGYADSAWGVLVIRIKRGGTAGKIGILPGSLLLKVGDTEVRTPNELRSALGNADPDKSLDLIWRTGRYIRRIRLKSGE